MGDQNAQRAPRERNERYAHARRRVRDVRSAIVAAQRRSGGKKSG
jgi:hypothetical protein